MNDLALRRSRAFNAVFFVLSAIAPACGSSSSGDKAAAPAPVPLELVKGLSIQEVAVFQGVKVSVAKDGAKVTKRAAPVVAGREGVVRVYVAPADEWVPRDVAAELQLSNEGGKTTVIKAEGAPSVASVDEDMSSTFNFPIALDQIAPDTKYVVTLKTLAGQGGKGSTAGARYPATGVEDLDAKSSGEVLKITIVPVTWGADGSSRLPDVSDTQIEMLRKRMYAMYPAKKVEITVREAMPWRNRVGPRGDGWPQLLSAVVSLRQRDGAPKDVYYYGAFAPAATLPAFCGGGCVAGLSPLSAGPADALTRASIGLGFTGEGAGDTMAHEIGHAHGRPHSPCGPVGQVDPAYPKDAAHAKGSIAVWGYDITKPTETALVSPKQARDVMGYCRPNWVSEYTYNKLFERIAAVNAELSIMPPVDRPEGSAAPRGYRFVDVAGDGTLTYGEHLGAVDPPLGEEVAVTYEAADGRSVGGATAHFYPYGDLPGGMLVVPETNVEFSRLRVPSLMRSVAVSGVPMR